jgi:hypothetical protein
MFGSRFGTSIDGHHVGDHFFGMFARNVVQCMQTICSL